eukprot:3867694-Ditylum_brightwellii.AAC.1
MNGEVCCLPAAPFPSHQGAASIIKGRVTLVNDLHSLNALSPILVTVEGMSIFSNLRQEPKALLPISAVPT